MTNASDCGDASNAGREIAIADVDSLIGLSAQEICRVFGEADEIRDGRIWRYTPEGQSYEIRFDESGRVEGFDFGM